MDGLEYFFGTGDGTLSTWHSPADLDLDHDGTLDAVALDFDGDGLRDDAMWDTDADGVADRAMLDLDDDGIAETGSAYAVGVTTDGSYYVGKFIGGVLTFLQDWTSTGNLYTDGTPNVVSITIAGNALTVVLNGALTWTGSDSDVAGGGRVGFLPYTNSSDPTTHYFDNVSVAPPA